MRSIGTQIGFSSLLDPYRYNVGRPDRRSFYFLNAMIYATKWFKIKNGISHLRGAVLFLHNLVY